MRFIYKIISILCVSMFLSAYTFDEDILAACGNKHPNDFVGRIACNNNMEKQNCLEREMKELEPIVIEIKTALIKNADINILEAVKYLSEIKDLKGIKIIPAPRRSAEKKNQEVGKEIDIVDAFMDSKCGANLYYSLGFFPNENKVVNKLKIWRHNRELEVKKPHGGVLEITSLNWNRSESEASIQVWRNIAERKLAERAEALACLKDASESFRKSSMNIGKYVKSKTTLSAAEIFNKIKIYYNEDNYIVEDFEEPSVGGEATRKIRVTTKCIPIGNEKTNLLYEIKIKNSSVEVLNIEGFGTQPINIPVVNWVSEERSLREAEKLKVARQKAEEKEKAEQAQIELLRETERESNKKIIIIISILVSGLLIGLAVEYVRRRKRKNKTEMAPIFEAYNAKDDNRSRSQQEISLSTIHSSHSASPDIDNLVAAVESVKSVAPSVNLDKNIPAPAPAPAPAPVPAPSEKAVILLETDKRLRSEFRQRNPFVKIDVPPYLFIQFLEECDWYKSKRGKFPDEDSQISIMRSLIR